MQPNLFSFAWAAYYKNMEECKKTTNFEPYLLLDFSGWRFWTVKNKAEYTRFRWGPRNASLDGPGAAKWKQ